MKRVLVIDDELVIRELMQEMLQMGGFESVALPDGSNALSLQRKYFFDLVITDLLMPVYDGISTIIALRKEFPDLKIIAISGGDFSEDGQNLLKKAKKLGACRTFSKPVFIKPFLAAIQDIFHNC